MANDSSKSKKNLGKLFLENIWGKREAGMRLPLDWSDTIRHEDVLFLLNRYPFLQMATTEPTFVEEVRPIFITAQSGWIIHDYGDAMSTSPGPYLYGPEVPSTQEGEGGEGGTGGTGTSGFTAGKGTVINQGVLTVTEMIALAAEKGWPGIQIIAGTPIMQWAAWMAAEDKQLTLEGYTPSKQDKSKRERIRKAIEIAETYTPQFRP